MEVINAHKPVQLRIGFFLLFNSPRTAEINPKLASVIRREYLFKKRLLLLALISTEATINQRPHVQTLNPPVCVLVQKLTTSNSPSKLEIIQSLFNGSLSRKAKLKSFICGRRMSKMESNQVAARFI